MLFRTNNCTKIKGGSNPQLLRKMKENITKHIPPLSKLIRKYSSELANKRIYNSNPSLDNII